MSESNERPDEPPFEAPDVEVPSDAAAPAGSRADAVDPAVDAGEPPAGLGGTLGEAPDVETPSDAPAPTAARPSRFSRSDSGEWVARRTSAEPYDPDGALLVAASASGSDGDSEGGDDDEAVGDASVLAGSDAPRRRRRRPSAPRMWLQGGTSTARWGWMLVGWAVVSLGAGVLVATAATEFIGGVLGAWIGTVALWVAMLAPVVVGFARSVPRGLLRFRATDVLFGVVFGVALRVVSGWFEQAAAGVTIWPSYPTLDGRLAGDWWFVELAVPVVIGPLIEEFFFHGLLLVALYTAFRRLTRARIVAGFGAALVSTGLFVLLHQLTGSLGASWASSASIALVGLVGSTLVLVTGRIWGAVLTHVVFNATFVALALVGTLVGAGTGFTLA